MLELIKPGTNINFFSMKKYAVIFSVAVTVLAILSIAAQGGLRYGVDFRGGTIVQAKFNPAVAVGDARAKLESAGIHADEVTTFGQDDMLLIRLGGDDESGKGPSASEIAKQAESALVAAYGEGKVSIERVETVGPKVGKDLRQKAVLAVLYSMVLILIYISLRFEYRFAVGAVVALLHDTIITLGLFSVLGKEITLPVIAAILTVIGYSLNDTIIVFDRVRENLRIKRGLEFTELVNVSMNETLSRTIITVLTVLFTILALFFFGGEVIHDFAFALLVGVAFGTYSSIYIASTIVVEWQARSKKTRLGFEKKRA